MLNTMDSMKAPTPKVRPNCAISSSLKPNMV
jgi:hypothetical protein